MDVLAILTSTIYSRGHMKQLVSWVGADQDKFDVLFDVFANQPNIELSNKASCALYYCVENHHALILPHIGKLINKIKEVPIEGRLVHRNGMKILCEVTIPTAIEAEVLDVCITFADDTSTLMATRAFAINVLTKIGKNYLELLHDMYEVVQKYYNKEGVAHKLSSKRFFALYKQLTGKV